MKISESYNRLQLEEEYKNPEKVREFWNTFETELITENKSKLMDFLGDLNWKVFQHFQIHPSEKKYFIGGSAILYLYPKLITLFELHENIGDLDVVIPDREYWERADLGEEFDNGGIFRADTETGEIEVFNVWDPSKAGEQFANMSIRSTSQILKDAKFIEGYWYMSIKDVLDYKLKLSRDKEIKVNKLIVDYISGKITDKLTFLFKLHDAVGLGNTIDYVKMTSQDEIKKIAQDTQNKMGGALA